uniref:DnaB-like replicative helicase n=1 Tax=Rhizobium phage IG49 TaxID=3129228 RepID=A0AAU8HZ96_9CAUD
MRISTERLIINSLFANDEYFRMAGQFLKPEYFEEQETRTIFTVMNEYITKYSERPSIVEVLGMVSELSINPESSDLIEEILRYEPDDEISTEWMTDVSEDYCKRRAMKIALMESLDIIEGKSKAPLHAVSDLMDRAVNFKFDPDLGLNFYEDIDRKIESYDENLTKIPFKLGLLNKITNGGMERKTVNVVAAPSGFGKSIWLGDEAVFQSKQGLNTVYVTFEMSDTRIGKRMDATANEKTLEEMRKMSEESLRTTFEGLRNKKHGYLIVKEYGPGEITAAKLRLYLKEVEMHMGEPVDVLVLDYLNLMVSARGTKDNSLFLNGKYVSEDLVSLAKKLNLAILTAVQFGRGGQKNSSPEVSDIAESQAITNTVDFLLAMFDTDEMAAAKRAIGKILKNRYGSKDELKTFIVGIERAMMRFFDVSENESKDLADNVRDNGPTDIHRAPKFEKNGKIDNDDFGTFSFE